MDDDFEILGEIQDIETIAVGAKIRELENLKEMFGKGRWRKLKGFANILLKNRQKWFAELHWYEASGVGRRKMKIKNLIRKLK